MTVEILSASEIGPEPQQFYAVARDPGLLAGMSYPSNTNWQLLHKSGYRHVVCLTGQKPDYDPRPLTVLYSVHLQDLAGGALPLRPEHEEQCIRNAVALILPRLGTGEGVAVHCAGGTGRTGTVVACALKALGLPVHLVLKQMSEVNAVRMKYPGWKGWPESPWQKALLDRF